MSDATIYAVMRRTYNGSLEELSSTIGFLTKVEADAYMDANTCTELDIVPVAIMTFVPAVLQPATITKGAPHD